MKGDMKTITSLITVAEIMADEYNMTFYNDRDCLVSYFNDTDYASNFIKLMINEDISVVLLYQIVTLYDTFKGEIYFNYDGDYLQEYPSHVNLYVNGEPLVDIEHAHPIRYKQAELLYYDFEWQLHLEFDKENIERTGCENEEISRKITNYVVKYLYQKLRLTKGLVL